jgi:hypothetical protein
MVTLG